MHKNSFFSLIAFILLILRGNSLSAQPAPIPPVFQDLYSSLQTQISSFTATIPAGASYPVGFGAQLTSASANVGRSLLAKSYYSAVLRELDGLKAAGAKVIYISVGFPIFYAPYFDDIATHQKYVAFYTDIARDVRARGLLLAVQNTYVLTFGAMAGPGPGNYYRSLTWDQYRIGRIQSAVGVIKAMRPDFMVIVQEPDTETLHTGQQEANTIAGAMQLVNQITAALRQTGITGTKIGAGVGTYHMEALDFVSNFTTTSIDFIDMHVYNANKNFLPQMMTIADMAAAAGKGVAISQAWLAKIRDSELLALSPNEMSARDPFSFWEPLDTYFMQTLVNFSRAKRLTFFCVFFSQYLRAYLPYDSYTQTLSPAEIHDAEIDATGLNIVAGVYTSVGRAYHRAITVPPDTQAPSVPTGLQARTAKPDTMAVSWQPASDNIGVAIYGVYRDGVQIGKTADTFFGDSGLVSGGRYWYTVRSFDLAGNPSPFTLAEEGLTMDVIPPAAPTDVVAVALPNRLVEITWTPSADNTSIAAYNIFKGSSRSNLVQVGTRKESLYKEYPVPPGTTAFYAIQAWDVRGNLSPLSKIVLVTTPQ